MFHPFESRFEAAWPRGRWCDSHVVLAVSGGADSVAMLRAALALKNAGGGAGKLFVAHLNHGLRGAEADADVAWLEGLCRRLNLPLTVGTADVSAATPEHGNGLEAAARIARYEFLKHTAEQLGARFVAVAHTADDQVETVLHHILRGTGIAGLAGIRECRPLSPSVTLVRPLLDVRRAEVIDYLAALGQEFRIDSTNADPRWTRNWLRNELLPALRQHGSADVDSALLRLAAQAGEVQQFLSEEAAEIMHRAASVEFAPREGNRLAVARRARIDCGKLSDNPPLVIREVCRRVWSDANWPQQSMGYKQWQQLAEMVSSECDPKPLNLPGNIRATREEDALILERLDLP